MSLLDKMGEAATYGRAFAKANVSTWRELPDGLYYSVGVRPRAWQKPYVGLSDTERERILSVKPKLGVTEGEVLGHNVAARLIRKTGENGVFRNPVGQFTMKVPQGETLSVWEFSD